MVASLVANEAVSAQSLSSHSLSLMITAFITSLLYNLWF